MGYLSIAMNTSYPCRVIVRPNQSGLSRFSKGLCGILKYHCFEDMQTKKVHMQYAAL